MRNDNKLGKEKQRKQTNYISTADPHSVFFFFFFLTFSFIFSEAAGCIPAFVGKQQWTVER